MDVAADDQDLILPFEDEPLAEELDEIFEQPFQEAEVAELIAAPPDPDRSENP